MVLELPQAVEDVAEAMVHAAPDFDFVVDVMAALHHYSTCRSAARERRESARQLASALHRELSHARAL